MCHGGYCSGALLPRDKKKSLWVCLCSSSRPCISCQQGQGLKRLLPEWDGSAWIFLALFNPLESAMSSREGRGQQMIFCIVLITLFRAKGCLLYSYKDGVFPASWETTCHLQWQSHCCPQIREFVHKVNHWVGTPACIIFHQKSLDMISLKTSLQATLFFCICLNHLKWYQLSLVLLNAAIFSCQSQNSNPVQTSQSSFEMEQIPIYP